MKIQEGLLCIITGWTIGIVLGIITVVIPVNNILQNNTDQLIVYEALLDRIYQDNPTYWEDVLMETDEFQEYLQYIDYE